MISTLILKQPIKILGKQVSELTYDIDEISCEDYADAFALRCDNGRPVTTVQEVDSVFALNLGFKAITAINPNITIEDLRRIKGADIVKISNIGRNFILGSLGENSQEPEQDSILEKE